MLALYRMDYRTILIFHNSELAPLRRVIYRPVCSPNHRSNPTATRMWLDIPKPDYQRTRQGSFSETDSVQSPDTGTWSINGKETSPIFKRANESTLSCDIRHDSDISPNPWRPFFLQRRALYAFMAIFILMGVAIEALFIVSEKRKGLATAVYNIKLNYVWTYGPMVIMTLISAVWAIVDFLSRVSIPWTRLREAKTEIDMRKALLLDYISSFSFTVPFEAMRNQDSIVAATTFVSLLLVIMIVFAPSLVNFTPVGFKIPVESPAKFVDDSSRLGNFGLLSLYNAIGLKRYRMQYPAGISSDYIVYQSVQTPTSEVEELHATVEGMTNDLECQPATLSSFSTTVGFEASELWAADGVVSNDEDRPRILMLNFTLQIPGCDFVLTGSAFNLSTPLNSNETNRNTPVTVPVEAGAVVTGQCKSAGGVTDSADLESWRLALVVWELDVTVLTTESEEWYNVWETNPVNATLRSGQQLICKPTYNIIDVDVTRDSRNITRVVPAEKPQAKTLGSVHAWDIANAVVSAYTNPQSADVEHWDDLRLAFMSAKEGEFYYTGVGIEEWRIERSMDTFLTAMMALGGVSYPDKHSIYNSTALELSARTFYRMNAAFLVRSMLMEPASGVATGYATISRDRFLVQPLTAHILAALCLLSVLAVWMTLAKLPNKFSLEGDPRTIVGVKTLAESLAPSFPGDLRGTGRLPDKANGIMTTNNPEMSSSAGTPPVHQPLSIRLSSRAAVCLCLVGIFVLLEVLQRKSQKDGGIGPYIASLAYLHYVWDLLPTLAASLIGMFFVSVDSELRSLGPYHALSMGLSSPRESVSLNLRGLLSPHALFRQISARHFAAAAATTSAMLAGLLATASGSLYVINSRPYASDRALRLVGSFSSFMYDEYYMVNWGVWSSSDVATAEASMVSSLLLQSNLSYPAFTYENLAFPGLALDGPETTLNGSETEIRAVVPALRSGLYCTLHPQQAVSADILHVDSSQTLTGGGGRLKRPMRWPSGDTIRVNVADLASFCPETYFGFPIGGSPELAATALFHIPEGKERVEQGVFGATSPFQRDIRINGCNSYFYVWGSYTRAANGKPGSVKASALSCNASIESVDVEASFWGPELVIRPEKPPAPRKETVQMIKEPSNANSRVAFNMSVYRDLYSLPFQEKGAVLDDFFKILITSPQGLPLETLGDQKKSDKVIDAIKYQHGIIMTQTLSMHARIPFPSYYENATRLERMNDKGVFERTGQGELNTTVYPASVHASTPRVMQDERSTRVMQGLLAATLVFAVLSWALAPRMAVLPRPATSVASIVALMVDGNVYQKGQEGGEGKGRSYRLGMGTTRCPEGSADRGDVVETDDDKLRFAIWVVDTPSRENDIELKGTAPVKFVQ
ncbi:hypothetical protein QBC43DRAFT_327460 [Cladorrhinum sp. PSN259]|nr:hypothetical protein QBC43DRAFT_327460 [Cladorrhinum sp. PSN259]